MSHAGTGEPWFAYGEWRWSHVFYQGYVKPVYSRLSAVLETSCGSQKRCGFGGFGIFVLTSGGKRLRIYWKPLCVWNVKSSTFYRIFLSCGSCKRFPHFSNWWYTSTSSLPFAILHVSAIFSTMAGGIPPS